VNARGPTSVAWLTSPSRWLPVAVGLCGVALTWMTWRTVRADEARAARADFEYRVRDVEQRLHARFSTYEQTLRATQGHVLTAGVDRERLHAFISSLDLQANYPGIQGVGFAHRLQPEGLDAHIASVRAEGYPAYSVYPPGERDVYTAIVFLEPLSGRNLRAIGYDMYSEPVRRAAMDLATELGDVVASGKVTLVQEFGTEVQAGFLMYLPVVVPGDDGQMIRGWVYSPFRVNDFMDGLLGERGDDIDIDLYDGDNLSKEAMLFDGDAHWASGKSETLEPPATLFDTRTLSLAHHTWTMTTRLRVGVKDRYGPQRSPLIAWLGGFVSLLLTALTSALLAARHHALALANERERHYQVLADAAPVLIWTSDPQGQCESVNAPWLSFTGRPLEAELGEGWTSGVHPDDQPAVAEALRAIRDHQPFALEHRLRHADGSWRWVLHAAVPRTTLDGRFLGHVGSCLDISEQKRVRDELARVVQEQTTLLETANVGIAMLVDRVFTSVNRGMRELFGYSRDELIGQSTRRLHIDQAAFERFGRVAHEALQANETYEAVVELRRKDGSTCWVQHNGRLVDPSDPSKGSLWILSDHTERRATHEALRRSEARFRNLFESHSAVMLLVDPEDGRLVDANPAAVAFYGYEREALTTLNIAAINQGSERASPGDRQRVVFPHRLATGEVRTVEVRSTQVDVDGRPLLFSIVQDVTEREQAHAALLRERERYRSLMSIAQDGIHLLDEQGNLVEANAAFARMLGYEPTAIPALNVCDWDASIPTDELIDRVRAQLTSPSLFETTLRRADGTVFEVEVNAGGVTLDGRGYVLASSRDITSRKQLEHELAQERQRLEEFNQTLAARVDQAVTELRAKDQLLITQSRQAAMGEMIGNIAHQWRQPLNALALVLSELRDASRYGELDEATLESAFYNGNRLLQQMSSTINDFRDFLRPDRGKVLFSAHAQVMESVGLLRASFEHVGIELDLDVVRDFEIYGSPNECAQVLMNLLANAKQAVRAFQPPFGRVTVRLDVREGAGVLSVEDNGGGIAPELVEKVFDPYFSTKVGGTGIGLYMSRQIVERSMGGQITGANSGNGALFVVRVPLGHSGAKT